MSWDKQEVKIISLEALNSDVLFMHTHMCIHALAHRLHFQVPQVIYITVNDSDELHMQSLLQALCLHVHMALGVNLIPTAVVMLEMPRVKQRWLGPGRSTGSYNAELSSRPCHLLSHNRCLEVLAESQAPD